MHLCSYCINSNTGVHKFSKKPTPPLNWRSQKGDIFQVPYWEPLLLEWPVTFALIRWFLHGACEMIHIFVCKKKCKNYADNIMPHGKPCSRPNVLTQTHIIFRKLLFLHGDVSSVWKKIGSCGLCWLHMAQDKFDSRVHADMTSHYNVFCSEERGGIFIRNPGTVSIVYYYYYYYYYYFLSWTHVNT